MLGDDNIIIVLSCVAHSLTFITTKWQNPKIKLKKNSFIILASVCGISMIGHNLILYFTRPGQGFRVRYLFIYLYYV